MILISQNGQLSLISKIAKQTILPGSLAIALGNYTLAKYPTLMYQIAGFSSDSQISYKPYFLSPAAGFLSLFFDLFFFPIPDMEMVAKTYCNVTPRLELTEN